MAKMTRSEKKASVKKLEVEEKLKPIVKKVSNNASKEIDEGLTTPLTEKAVKGFVDALYKLQKVRTEATTKGKNKSSQLFDDFGTERINLMISSIKLPAENRQQNIKFDLPHSTLPSPCDVCLIVKDLEKGIKVDHEPTANHFKEILRGKGIGPELVSTVMPLRELRVEYNTYEAKNALCGKFDIILADDRIVKFLPPLLGRAFYRKKKFPVQINLKTENLKKEIEKALHQTFLPLNHRGTSSMVTVGNMAMTQDQVVQNLLKIAGELEAKFPAGMKNVRSMHLKTETSMAVPIFVSEVCANSLGFVDAKKPKIVKRQPVTDEVTTVPGFEVTVYPSGKVKLKRKADPVWESFKSSRDDSDEDDDHESDENSDDEEKQQEKKKLKVEKKKKTDKKVEANEASSSSKKQMAKKKNVVQEDMDSEDEEMERSEQFYLSKKQSKTDEQEPIEEVLPPKESDSDEFDDDQDLEDTNIIKDLDGSDVSGDSDDELVIRKDQNFIDDSGDEENVKPKRAKLSKKDRRVMAKKQKAEGITKKSKKTGSAIKKSRKPKK